VHATFADSNADDPYRVEAKWSSMPEYWIGAQEKKTASKTNCKGTCKFSADYGSWSHPVVLLQGFRFTRPTGDRNIKRVAVFAGQGTQNQKKILEFTAMLHDAGAKENNEFSVEITYVTVPVGRCLKRESAIGKRGKGQTQAKLPAEKGLKAITGFSLEFLEGDHHLESLGIQAQAEGHFLATMNDANFDDEVKAHVNYCLIDQAGAEKGGPDPVVP